MLVTRTLMLMRWFRVQCWFGFGGPHNPAATTSCVVPTEAHPKTSAEGVISLAKRVLGTAIGILSQIVLVIP